MARVVSFASSNAYMKTYIYSERFGRNKNVSRERITDLSKEECREFEWTLSNKIFWSDHREENDAVMMKWSSDANETSYCLN